MRNGVGLRLLFSVFGDVDFGEDDANIEYEVSRITATTPIFIRAFFYHPQVNLDDFRSAREYLILGQNGTGKTPIPRRLQLEFEQQGNSTQFMIFRDEVASLASIVLGRCGSYRAEARREIPHRPRTMRATNYPLGHRIVIGRLV